MAGSANAWPWMTDPDAVRRDVAVAHERFADSGRLDPGVRSIVGRSWLRSARQGVDPSTSGPRVELDRGDLRDRRREHPLAAVMPLVRHLLVDAAPEAQIVAVGDAGGRLLWVEGDHRLRTRAEQMHFVEGANWNEGSAGTNAPGLAVTVDHEVQIFAVEHFARGVHAWSCSAAPLHDPATGRVLGFLDLTGTDDHVASPAALALVRAAATAADAELRALHAAGRMPAVDPRDGVAAGPGTSGLSVLGRDRALLSTGNGTTVELSARHSEILLLLALHPGGLTGGALGGLLTDRGTSPVTVRAEMARLRGLVGEEIVASRPYRLRRSVRTDADRVRALLAEGALADALRTYPGHLLPASTAPGAVEARDELQAELCAVLESADDPGVLLAWAEHPAWREDPRAVAAAVAALPQGSPRCRALAGRLAWLGR